MNPIPDWWYADEMREETQKQLRAMIESEERLERQRRQPARIRTYQRIHTSVRP